MWGGGAGVDMSGSLVPWQQGTPPNWERLKRSSLWKIRCTISFTVLFCYCVTEHDWADGSKRESFHQKKYVFLIQHIVRLRNPDSRCEVLKCRPGNTLWLNLSTRSYFMRPMEYRLIYAIGPFSMILSESDNRWMTSSSDEHKTTLRVDRADVTHAPLSLCTIFILWGVHPRVTKKIMHRHFQLDDNSNFWETDDEIYRSKPINIMFILFNQGRIQRLKEGENGNKGGGGRGTLLLRAHNRNVW